MAKKTKVQVHICRSRVDGSLSVTLTPEDAIVPDDKAEEVLEKFFKMEEDELKYGRHISGWATTIEIDE
jgi:hypothetical protein